MDQWNFEPMSAWILKVHTAPRRTRCFILTDNSGFQKSWEEGIVFLVREETGTFIATVDSERKMVHHNVIDFGQAWIAVCMNGDDRHPHLSNAMLGCGAPWQNLIPTHYPPRMTKDTIYLSWTHSEYINSIVCMKIIHAPRIYS